MKTKSLKLITEAANTVEMVKQDNDPSKPFTMKFRGLAACSEKVNANHRVYPYELLKREIERYDKDHDLLVELNTKIDMILKNQRSKK